MTQLLSLNENGLYCKEGDFYIDPWKPVKTAFVTHGHSDHAREGHKKYYSTNSSIPILRSRLGEINVIGLDYSEELVYNGIKVSFHPAGHVLGSAQIKVDNGKEVWVVSGDYKRDNDPTCESFELVECDTFITEATFALPIYRWPRIETVIDDINTWMTINKEEGRTSILFCYSLGKAQRLLAELLRITNQSVYVHGALESMIQIYRDAGTKMVPTVNATEQEKGFDFSKELVLAPPSAHRSNWMKRFGDASTGFVSGWMAVRAQKTQGGYDKGFVLSDHCDWYDLIRTIKETQASTVYVTHGKSDILVRYLQEELEINAMALKTDFQDEE